MTGDNASLPCDYRNIVAAPAPPPGLSLVGDPPGEQAREQAGDPAPVVLQCRVHGEPWPCPHDNGAPPPRPRGRRSHILREAPPWRRLDPAAQLRTECGKTAASDGKVLVAGTRAELLERVRVEGREVLAQVCKACRTKSDLHADASWQRNPGALIARDVDPSSPRGDDQLTRELHALAAIAAAHPEEFAALVTATVPTLEARREARG